MGNLPASHFQSSQSNFFQILSDVEILVKDLSEELVSDLSVRDELEYEKELKNTFISLLLSIQSKRRQHAAEGGHKTRCVCASLAFNSEVFGYSDSTYSDN